MSNTLSSTRPPRRPLADRVGLRLYLGDRLRWRLHEDRTPAAPEAAVFANCVEQELTEQAHRAG